MPFPDIGLGIDLSADTLLRAFIWLVALIFSLSVHEAAHAWMAYKRGDGTAYYQGRMTLDPVSHIDPIGTIVIPLVVFLTGFAFMFGWARPVPVNIYNLIKPARDWMLVALAGPISNLIQAAIWLVLLKIYDIAFPFRIIEVIGRGELIEQGMGVGDVVVVLLGLLIFISIIINIVLAGFNLIPVPPLDGSRVLNYFLPPEGRDLLYRLEPYGFLFLLILLWTGIVSAILVPIYSFAIRSILFVLSI